MKAKTEMISSIGRIACLVFLTVMIIVAACAIPLMVIGKTPGTFMNASIAVAIFLATVIRVKSLDGKELADAGLLFRPVDALYFLGGAGVVFAAYAAFTIALSAADGVNYFPQFTAALLNPGRSLLNFFLIPFVEEVFLRGYIQGTTFLNLSWNRRAILSALLFSAPHWLDTEPPTVALYIVSRVVATFLFGLLFNELRRRTGSIWMGLGAHWITNFVFVNLFTDTRFYPPVTIMLAVTLLAAVVVLYAMQYQKRSRT